MAMQYTCSYCKLEFVGTERKAVKMLGIDPNDTDDDEPYLTDYYCSDDCADKDTQTGEWIGLIVKKHNPE